MIDALGARLDGWLSGAPALIGPHYPWLSAAHILALGALIGFVLVLDLRLLGLFRSLALAPLVQVLSRLAGFALIAAVLSGLVLFSVQPSHYLGNSAFLLKLGLMVLVMINIAVVHLSAPWQRVKAGRPASAVLRLLAASSLLLWVAVVLAGRWVAFV
ncbi:MAG: DUF2214 domain-containing protein [Wenzhouxiangella sp.]|nr:DUF2214 domain-containing protein [Wenzhouxiangella sp.]